MPCQFHPALFKVKNGLCCTLDQTKIYIVRAKAGVGLFAPFAVAVQQSCADCNLTGLSKNMLRQFIVHSVSL